MPLAEYPFCDCCKDFHILQGMPAPCEGCENPSKSDKVRVFILSNPGKLRSIQ